MRSPSFEGLFTYRTVPVQSFKTLIVKWYQTLFLLVTELLTCRTSLYRFDK